MESEDTLLKKFAEDLDLTLHEFLEKGEKHEDGELDGELARSMFITQFEIMEFMDKMDFYSKRGVLKKSEYKRAMRKQAEENPPLTEELYFHIKESSPQFVTNMLNRYVAYLGKGLNRDGNVDIYGPPYISEDFADFLVEIAQWKKQQDGGSAEYNFPIQIDADGTINLIITASIEKGETDMKCKMCLQPDFLADTEDYNKVLKRLYKLNDQTIEAMSYGDNKIKWGEYL